MGELIKNDDELAAIEQEAVQETMETEAPEAEIETGFDFEIVDSSMYGKEKSDELVAAETKLAELEAAIKAKESSNVNSEALTTAMQSIQEMQKQLAGGIKLQKDTPSPEPIDIEALKKSFNTELFNDPFAVVSDLITKVAGPLKAELDQFKANQSKADARAELLMSDENRNFYSKYRDEVDQMAAKIDAPDAYSQALKLVKADHIEDLVAEQVQAALANATKATPNVPFTNTGTPTAPAGRQKAKITRGMQEWMQVMRNKGISDESYLLERATALKKAGDIRN